MNRLTTTFVAGVMTVVLLGSGIATAAAVRDVPIAAARSEAPTSRSEATPALPTLTSSKLAQLDAYVRDAMKRFGIPGAEVAVVWKGHVVQLKGYGVRAIGSTSPVTPDTLMLIGSTGKSMTTLMMGTLVDDGDMSWNTRAVKVLPWFRTSDPKLTPILTLRDLVSNSTGIQQRDAILRFADSWTPTDLIHSITSLQFTGQFLKTYGYSNQMVATGGYLAAQTSPQATGNLHRDFTNAMQQRVFNPIGMTRTTFSFDAALASPDHATGSTFNLNGKPATVASSVERGLIAVGPAGGAWSNAHDMARYLLTQLARGVAPNGKRVISEDNLTKTWTPQVEIKPGISYGLGWEVGQDHGQTRITHNGGTVGFGSTVDFLPQSQLGVVVLANVSDASLFGTAVAGRLYELAFDRPFELDPKVAAAYAEIRAQLKQADDMIQPGADPHDVSKYTGVYRNAFLGTITITQHEGRLVLSAATFSTPLGWIGNHQYVALKPPVELGVLHLTKDAAGKPALIYTPNSSDDLGRYLFKRR